MKAVFFAGIGPLFKRDTVFALVEDVPFTVIEQFYKGINAGVFQGRNPFLLQYPDDTLKPVNVPVAAGGIHIDIADY